MKKLPVLLGSGLIFLLIASQAQAQNYQTWENKNVQFLAPYGFTKIGADAEKFEGKVEGASIHHFGIYDVKESISAATLAASFKSLAQDAGLMYAGTQNLSLGNLKGMYAQGSVSKVPAYFAVLYDDSGTKFSALIVHNNPAVAMSMLNSFRKR